MPYALTITGLVLVIVAWQNTYSTLGNLLTKDFTGPGNFTYWLAAIIILGAIGYYAPFRPLSRGLLVLLIVTMILANGGFAQKFTAAIQNGPQLPTPDPVLSPGGAAAAPSNSSAGNVAATVGKVAQLASFALV